jgi:transposase-like protein
MTKAKRECYTREFKQDAVALVAGKRCTIAEAARGLGVSENMLGRGKCETETDGTQASRGLGVRTARPRICIDSGRRTGDSGSSATF